MTTAPNTATQPHMNFIEYFIAASQIRTTPRSFD
jgi:hypothetical protein